MSAGVSSSCGWTLLENFKPGDLHLVLTYRKENRPADKSLLKKDMQAFLRKCRAVYKKQGRELRYIWVCEYESTAPHFHIILPRIDPGLLQDIWPHGNIRPGYLYAEGELQTFGSLSHQGDQEDLPPEAGQRAEVESVQEPAEAPDHH